MSDNPFPWPPDPPPITGFDEVALSALTKEVQDTIQQTQGECQEPVLNLTIPKEAVTDLFNWVCGWLRALGVSSFVAHVIAGTVCAPVLGFNVLASVVITVFAPLITAFIAEVLGLLDLIRKNLDPAVAQLSTLVLNELLGTDLTPDMIVTGKDFGSHIARAGIVGGLLHDTLLREFEGHAEILPADGVANARKFTGIAINFGTVTGTLAFLGGLVPGIELSEIREIGENVAKNIGLGRLQRLAMQPLIKTLIQVPYQWALNMKFHPTPFTVQELINPFTQSVMPPSIVFDSLDRLGYSHDKIVSLIDLHRKKAPDTAILRAFRYGEIDRTTTIQALEAISFSEAEAAKVVSNYERERIDVHVEALVSTLLDLVKFGNIDQGDLEALLSKLPLLSGERDMILGRAIYLRKQPHRSLTVAQLEKALEEKVIALDEFEAKLATLGYDTEDVLTLEILTLIAQKKLDDAAKAKAAKAAAAAAKKQAKASGPAALPPAPGA